MDPQEKSLRLALTAFEVLKTPARITNALLRDGRSALYDLVPQLDSLDTSSVVAKAGEMWLDGIRVVLFGDEDYPASLVVRGKPLAPILFYKGRAELFYRPSVGMCGSRNVSDLGLQAATTCGNEVSRHGLTVVSGYAKGVDSATHLAALRADGSTVIVLAEGFDHFRIKKDFQRDLDFDRTLVVSQFPPSQPWKGFGAMARNSIIFGLSKSLVVIEAGERGGTLAAGEGAMKIGRPVLVLDFGDSTPAGNLKLLMAGAKPVRSPQELSSVLERIPTPTQPVTEPKLF